jgi:hypothetical protein
MNILGLSSFKISKGEAHGYLTGIIYLNPKDYDICPMATAVCREVCIYGTGKGNMPNVIAGRTRKTELYLNDYDEFERRVRKDIAALIRKAARDGLLPAVRFNGTSDLPFVVKFRQIMADYPEVQFYDYTKVLKYWRLAQDIPNYHVTFSASGENADEVLEVLARGGQVAIVSGADAFSLKCAYGICTTVEEGDSHDLTFLRDSQLLVLSPKGKAKKDTSGFNHIPLVDVAAAKTRDVATLLKRISKKYIPTVEVAS